MKNRKNIKRCLITSVLIGGLAVLPAGNQIVGDYGQIADEIQQVQKTASNQDLLAWRGSIYPEFCFQNSKDDKNCKPRIHFWIWEKLWTGM